MKKKTVLVEQLDWSGDACTAELKRFSADFFYPLHWHDYFELEILLSGEGDHLCNGKAYPIKAGDAWIMSYYDFHEISIRKGAELLHVCFTRGVLMPELEELVCASGLCAHFEGEELEEIKTISRTLLREFSSIQPCADAAKKNFLNRFAILLLRNAEERSTTEHAPFIGAALAYVHKHFREPISIESVAEAQGLSPNYFGSRFRASMGISFREYLNKIRLKYACGLLSSSEVSIKEIAFASGYLSIEYFFYVFRKNLGMTPTEYRTK